jgi:hypothetical protein
MRIALSDGQKRQLEAAAATLRYESRDSFACDDVSMLEAKCHGRVPTNDDITAAIDAALGITPFRSSVLVCDAASTTKEASMARQQRISDFDDDENFETLPSGQRVLRDKGVMRTRMAAMDGVSDAAQRQRATMRDAARQHFARRYGLRDSSDLHRPGFRLQPDKAARGEKLAAHDAYEERLTTLYLSPHAANTGGGSQGQRETREEGDSCLIGGMEGHLVEIDGELTCIPDSVDDAASLSDREIAHLKYLDHVSNAWRNPAGDVVSDRGPARCGDVASTRDAVEAAYAAYDAEIQERWRNPT